MPNDTHELPVLLSSRERLRLFEELDLPRFRGSDVPDTVAELAASCVAAPAGMVNLVEADRQYLVGQSGLLPERLEDRRLELSPTPCQLVVETGQEQRIGDLAAHPSLGRGPAVAELGIAAYAGVPIWGRQEKALGALSVVDFSPRSWSDDDLLVLRRLADLVASELELHRFAREREEAERRYQRLLRTSPHAIYTLDRDGLFIELNAAGAAILARPVDDVLGRHFSELVAPEDRAGVEDAFERIVAGAADQVELEAAVLHGSGTRRTALVSVTPVVEAGRIVGAQGIAQDVTERREAERERKRLLEIVQHTPDFIGVQSAEGEALWHNARARELLGDPAEAGEGWLYDVHPRWAADRVVSEGLPAARRDGSWTGETALVGLDGAEIHVSQLILAHRDEDGEVRSYSTVMRDITELKRTERALRESEQLHRTLIEHALAGIYLIQDDRLVFANPVMSELFGYSATELDGCPVANIVAPEDRPLVAENLRRRTAGEVKSLHYPFTGLKKDGTRFTVEVLGAQMQYEGRPAVVGMLMDITERERAERALRESEERFRQLAENIRGAFWMTTADFSRNLYASPGFEEVFGLGVDEVYARPRAHLDLVHPDDRDRVRAAFPVGLSEPTAVEYRIRHPDGRERWILDRAFPVRDDAGETYRIAGIAEDVTEQREAEWALRESESRFRELADNTDQIFWISDAAMGGLLYVSSAYERVWGRSTESLYRDPASYYDHVHPEDRGRVKEGLKQLGTAVTYRMRRPDGAIRWMESRAFPVRDPDGAVRRVAGITEDITERKQLEEQLRQSQKMEAVGQLAGGVAHDFNNILTAIGGIAELAREDVEDDALRQDFDEIIRAASRAADLTRQLLAFSRRQVLRPEILDLNEVISHTGKMLRRLIGEDVEMATVLEDGIGRIEADPGQIEQVLMNLAVNARDAMPSGGRLIVETATVDLGPDDLEPLESHLVPGPHVRLRVSDTGVGMSDETLRHIFEPFFTTKEVGKGTGLGLATVYGIIQQSGGAIRVASKPGRGTTFSVFLPQVIPADASDDSSRPADRRGTSHGTVLVVEDEASLRRLTRRVLERRGYTVLQAAHGEEGLRVAESHPGPIDLVLADVVMPLMSGPEMVARLFGSRPGIRVLYTTGYTEDEAVRRGVEHGEMRLLPKPFTPNALADAVDAMLEGDDGGDEDDDDG